MVQHETLRETKKTILRKKNNMYDIAKHKRLELHTPRATSIRPRTT